MYQVDEQNFVKRVKAHRELHSESNLRADQEIIYHPTYPQESIIPENLPGPPRVDAGEQITLEPSASKLLVALNAIAPLLTIRAFYELVQMLR